MTDASSKNILIIQTAFIGDTILASHFARAVKEQFPNSKIHFFLRKGNESVIQGLPTIEKTWIWDKQGGKTKNLFKLISELRKIKFDMVFNLHRHFNSGLVTSLMKSPIKVGFKQNPMSFAYTHKVNHQIPDPRGWHEVQRNLELLKQAVPTLQIGDNSKNYKPELPIQQKNIDKVSQYVTDNYFVVAPASVWFTKAWSEHKYRELTVELAKLGKVYFIGAPSDKDLCDRIRQDNPNTVNLCGGLNLLDSAALMKNARRVFVNDSAPLHLASCVNAKTTAVFCSTIPGFGYTPLADDSVVVDVGDSLSCRPCGLHGYKACPLGHFKCAEDIEIKRVMATIH
ncbi:glycosyltransferase family 9 protein [Peredibacter sp. HCB2-198]|uniref:glycosyltransferase family 9 protein n=1 Tax=Peredibacter sp. HCB2-198 TaxID=3383025 RepID=UPI0038B42B2A